MTKISPPATGFSVLPPKQDVSEGADMARIRYYRNQIAHNKDGKLSVKDFTDWWTNLENIISRFGGTILLHEARTLRVTSLDDSTKDILKEVTEIRMLCQYTIPFNIRESIAYKITSWKEEEKHFVETSASRHIEKAILNNSCVVVIGNPGSGKTATVHHIGIKLQYQGFTVIPVNEPNEIVLYKNADEKQIFLMDDICGENTFDNYKFSKWKIYSEDVELSLKQTNGRLLCTSRLIISSSGKYKSLALFQKCVVNIHNDKNCLSCDERQLILKSYIKRDIHVPQYILELHDNFPLLCRLFASKTGFSKNPEMFFKDPFTEYCKELDSLSNAYDTEGIYQYCALVCCIIFGNKLTSMTLEKETKRLKQICQACGMNTGTSFLRIQRALNDLNGVYVRKVGDHFHIIHSTMKNIIAWHAAKTSFSFMIRNAPLALLNDRLRIEKTKPQQYDQFIIELKEEYIEDFVTGLVSNLTEHKFVEVFNCQCFPNAKIEQKIFLSLERNNNLQTLLDYKCMPKKNPTVDYFNTITRELVLKCSQNECLNWVVAYGWLTFFHQIFLQDNFKTILHLSRETFLDLALFGSSIQMADYLHGKCALFSHCNCRCFICKQESKNSSLHLTSCPLYCVPRILIPCLTGNKEILEYVMKVGLCTSDDINCQITKPTDSTTPLLMACTLGHMDVVEYLLSNGANVNFPDKNMNVPLHKASAIGREDIVERLCREGAEINTRNAAGNSPLMIASKNGHIDIVKRLCIKNAVIDLKNNKYSTALHIASSEGCSDIVKYLITMGAEINIKDVDGWTPLIFAVYNNHVNVVELLIELNADINVLDFYGQSTIFWSVFRNNWKITSLLLDHGGDVELSHSEDEKPLIIACAHGNSDIVELLLQKRHFDRRFDIVIALFACRSGNVSLLNMLLNNGFSVNSTDEKMYTPLYVASMNGEDRCVSILLENCARPNTQNQYGYTAMYAACYNEHENIVTKLIQAGADIAIGDKDDHTPLHVACYKNNEKIIRSILETVQNESQVHVDLENNEGYTPLHLACEYDYIKIATLLVQYGASVNASNIYGETALHIASRKGNSQLVSLLLRNGAHVIPKNNPMPAKIHSRNTVQEKDTFDIHTDSSHAKRILCSGNTPLHEASKNDHEDVVKILLNYEADVNAVNKNGDTPLDGAYSENVLSVLLHDTTIRCSAQKMIVLLTEAIHRRNQGAVSILITKGTKVACVLKKDLIEPFLVACELECNEIVKIFLSNGIDVNASGYRERPLNIAYNKNNNELFSMLLKYNANVNSLYKFEESLLHKACRDANNQIVSLLLDHGADVLAENMNGETPFDVAYDKRDWNLISNLSKYADDIDKLTLARGHKPLLHTVLLEKGDQTLAIHLLEQGASIDKQNAKGETVVLVETALNDLQTVLFCIKNCADLNIPDLQGYTPLHMAASNKNVTMIETLLDNNSRVELRNNARKTVLDIAKEVRLDVKIITLLKEAMKKQQKKKVKTL